MHCTERKKKKPVKELLFLIAYEFEMKALL